MLFYHPKSFQENLGYQRKCVLKCTVFRSHITSYNLHFMLGTSMKSKIKYVVEKNKQMNVVYLYFCKNLRWTDFDLNQKKTTTAGSKSAASASKWTEQVNNHANKAHKSNPNWAIILVKLIHVSVESEDKRESCVNQKQCH